MLRITKRDSVVQPRLDSGLLTQELVLAHRRWRRGG